jgi:hypothetical protein
MAVAQRQRELLPKQSPVLYLRKKALDGKEAASTGWKEVLACRRALPSDNNP